MIRSLWIAKTGLDAQQTQMDVISHNLANVSTNGYKRSQAVFEDLIYFDIFFPHIKPLILHRFSTLWITPVDIGVNLCIVWVKS